MAVAKRIVRLLIVGAIAAAIVNDGGRYLLGQYDMARIARDAATLSAEALSHGADRTASWKAGQDMAQALGAEVYGFDTAESRVRVWTRMPVRGTWLLHYASFDKKRPGVLIVEGEAMTAIP